MIHSDLFFSFDTALVSFFSRGAVMCPTTEGGCELQPGPVDIPEFWLLPSVGPRVCTGSVKKQKAFRCKIFPCLQVHPQR